MKKNKIKVFYDSKMVPDNIGDTTETPSPMKPKLLMDFFKKEEVDGYFNIVNDFEPFENKEFYLAHDKEYVDGFFEGLEPYSNSDGLLGIDWSPSYATSVRYTNSSLYNAIKKSIENPSEICLSPTSGFHHAIPKQGALFCAFSGQVISAIKIFNEFGLKGSFIDLDGHFGNSIEDSREFVKELNVIIPQGANINIKTEHGEYLQDFKIRLLILEELVLAGKVDYVVFCHGADSHEYDDLGRQLNTKEWVECSSIFSEWIIKLELKMKAQIPISLSLFGGYRKDDYQSVLSLHTTSILNILSVLSETEIKYEPKVKKRLTTKTKHH